MSRKNKKLARSTPKVAPKVARADNPNKKTRAKLPWQARALLRCTRAGKLIAVLGKSITRAAPPTIDAADLELLAAGLKTLEVVMGKVAALPADFKPKRTSGSGSRSGVEIGSTVGVKEDARDNPLFEHIPADTFELAVVLGEDGKQNWLVRCADGAVRTVRKLLVEPVDAADEEAPDAEDAELLDDEDAE